MNDQDKRLIEDYLPIVAISAEASREKSVRKGHISTLHLWWARRPLVACRAAVYGALVPASQFVPNNGTDTKKKSIGRANAAKFVTSLCNYPGDPKVIAEAQRHILDAHAERLAKETGKPVTVADIEAGSAPRPKVLDMFAGGGAIPLEALRLGCEAYALDLNPVAHLIQLCTLVYPQKHGKPDPNSRGMTGPTNEKNESTWGGLANEVRYWGERVLKNVKTKIGDLYPLIPDPAYKKKREPVKDIFGTEEEVPPGYLAPIAYLWTRTVTCKNPTCKSIVPLLRQTWLCKKKDRNVAMRVVALDNEKRVRFEVVESNTAKGLGFDPDTGSKGGNATCPFCGTVADAAYVKAEAQAGRVGHQRMATVCRKAGAATIYVSADDSPDAVTSTELYQRRLEDHAKRTGLGVPDELIEANPRSMDVQNFGFNRWGDLCSLRQQVFLLALTSAIQSAASEMDSNQLDRDRLKALTTLLAMSHDRVANYCTVLCVWRTTRTCVLPTFSRQALPMVWDYGEMNPFAGSAGDWSESIEYVAAVIESCASINLQATVMRGSASSIPIPDNTLDAVITDPPYYDNVSYSNLSDFFYVWLKRNVGKLHSEHFAGSGTPKKSEAIAAFYRHEGSKQKARAFYESIMGLAFGEAHRVLKPNAPLIVVYAHKTTLGWATLVDALRQTGFQVSEAWPIDTEMTGGMRTEKASLASSIFLTARKRAIHSGTGSYETDVQPELEAIVRERVETLWDMGISGADLVIACVGAGLRAFTRFAKVEYANGEEVPAERFLLEVETVVLDSILGRLSKEVGGKGTSLAGVDPATRFYTLWRYTYRAADLDAGEAIIFANGTHVELDGQNGMSNGADALVEKKKGKFRLRDFTERGDDDKLGQPTDTGLAAPLVDVLHRVLWLMEHRPRELATFLREAEPNREQLRLVAQALGGPALKGGEMADVSPTAEMAALAKLTSNWRSVIEDNATTAAERADVKRGQNKLFE